MPMPDSEVSIRSLIRRARQQEAGALEQLLQTYRQYLGGSNNDSGNVSIQMDYTGSYREAVFVSASTQPD